jgi:DnaD/phage-associated family protein
MKAFTGFTRSEDFTPLPAAFFDQLLPAMDDLAELKLLLHVIALLARQKGWPRCVSRSQLSRDEQLRASLAAIGDLRSIPDLLDHALERASQRAALLRITVKDGDGSEEWFLLNTERGRAFVRDVRVPGSDASAQSLALFREKAAAPAATLEAPRPNIFALYEQNVGLLNRLIAEDLMEAEATYPDIWIEEAFRIAVQTNKRNWRYIKAILARWAAEGREDGTIRRHTGEVRDAETDSSGAFGLLRRR